MLEFIAGGAVPSPPRARPAYRPAAGCTARTPFPIPARPRCPQRTDPHAGSVPAELQAPCCGPRCWRSRSRQQRGRHRRQGRCTGRACWRCSRRGQQQGGRQQPAAGWSERRRRWRLPRQRRHCSRREHIVRPGQQPTARGCARRQHRRPAACVWAGGQRHEHLGRHSHLQQPGQRRPMRRGSRQLRARQWQRRGGAAGAADGRCARRAGAAKRPHGLCCSDGEDN